MEKTNTKRSYFLGYLTANDDPSFLIDYLNIKNMVRYHPGVSPIHVCITVSKVREINNTDRQKIKEIKKALLKARHVSNVKIIIKDNIGRDFSSSKKCLEYFSRFSSDDDYILIRNRSGYGPFENQWYLSYVKQNQKMPDGGLTGSTINQNGLPDMEKDDINTHVQTYAYLSQWKHFKNFVHDFPGSACKCKEDVILEGELGLSSSFLNRGFSLNCLEWEKYVFTSDNNRYSELPEKDIKRLTTKVPIRFRYRRYIYRFWSIFDGIIWNRNELFKLIFIKKLNHMKQKA